MKTSIGIVMAAFLVTLPITSAELSDVEMSARRLKLDESKERARNETIKSKKIAYEITVESKSFQDIPKLEIKYMLFYSDAKPGEKDETVLASVKGSESITDLKSRSKVKLKTKPITLETVNLDGGWSYTSGASSRARDDVEGLWIRAYADGEMVGEYINPSTLDRKNDWKD